jgi:hypothetical protein
MIWLRTEEGAKKPTVFIRGGKPTDSSTMLFCIMAMYGSGVIENVLNNLKINSCMVPRSSTLENKSLAQLRTILWMNVSVPKSIKSSLIAYQRPTFGYAYG